MEHEEKQRRSHMITGIIRVYDTAAEEKHFFNIFFRYSSSICCQSPIVSHIQRRSVSWDRSRVHTTFGIEVIKKGAIFDNNATLVQEK